MIGSLSFYDPFTAFTTYGFHYVIQPFFLAQELWNLNYIDPDVILLTNWEMNTEITSNLAYSNLVGPWQRVDSIIYYSIGWSELDPAAAKF